MTADRTTRALLGCGVAAGPLFVAVFLVTGAVRLGYDPVRHPVSSLALTSSGWTQVVNFLVTGALMVAFAVGLRRALRDSGAGWKPVALGAVGIGLVGAGVFLTDPVSGYPAGTPDQLQYTTHGALHDAFSAPVFIGLPAAGLAFAVWFGRRGRPAWSAYSALTAVVFLAAFVAASAAFSQAPAFVDHGGLYQRIALAAGFAWTSALALDLRRAV